MHDNRSDGSFSIGGKVWPGLGKLVEETGELNVGLGKLIATFGDPSYTWEDRDLAQEVLDEAADVVAAAVFFVHSNNLDKDYFTERWQCKLAKYHQWREDGEG